MNSIVTPPMEQGQRNGNGEMRIKWSVVVTVIGWILAAAVTYAAITARMAVAESELSRVKDDVREIRQEQRNQGEKLNDVQSDVKSLLKRTR